MAQPTVISLDSPPARSARDGSSPGSSSPLRIDVSRGVSRNTSQHSILSGKSGREQRSDAYGNVIERGKKMHKCTFRDAVDPSAPLEETKEVAAYKGGCWMGDYGDAGQPGCCSAM
mmetsp:Transcript_79226/g.246059  ORF Transcript_79226/g.246059 Transcript_79226/m.246059 type:complete len:116 (+) Transcript_79226:132-479(+)